VDVGDARCRFYFHDVPRQPVVLARSSEVAISPVPVALARPSRHPVRILSRVGDRPVAMAMDLVRVPRASDRSYGRRNRPRCVVGQCRHPAAIRTGHGYEGTEEYAPLGCDLYDLPGAIVDPESLDVFKKSSPTPLIQRFAPDSRKALEPSAHVSMDKWLPERKGFRIETAEPVTLALRLLNYPAWAVQIDGVTVAPGSQPGIARMLVSVPAGQHRVEVNFRRTWDRTAGAAISGFSLILLAGCVLFVRRGRNRSQS
jgi:hypothetical protein